MTIIITLMMIFFPRADPKVRRERNDSDDMSGEKIYDWMLILRIVVLFVLTSCVIAGGGGLFSSHFSVDIYAKPVKVKVN